MLSLDPRARLALCFILSLATAFLTSPAAAAAAAFFALLLFGAFYRGAMRNPLKRLLTVNAFLVVFWILTPFSTAGEPVWSAGPLTATREGLELTAAATLRCNAIFLTFCTCTTGMTLSIFARALRGLGCPDRLVTLLLLTERQAVHLNEERVRVDEAARLRHFSPGLNMRTYRTLAAMVSLIFLHALRHNQILSDSLKLRLFEGRWPVHAFPRLSRKDILALASGVAAAVFLLAANVVLT